MNLLELFCDVDDFCQNFIPQWQTQLISSGCKKRRTSSRLSFSEIMTIIIRFHQSHFIDFKAYYFNMLTYHRSEFPNLVSYNRFVELQKSVLIPLCAYLHSRFGQVTGIAFIDSTKIKVCHRKRIKHNKVFANVAKLGKSSMGWFYGFKLHLIVNEYGELLAVKLTKGNVDDRTHVTEMVSSLFGKLFGDKGYISQDLTEKLRLQGVDLITSIRKNMKPKLMSLMDKLLLRKRSIIETVNDQLKNISQVEHTRHRSISNFMVNMVAALIAYTHQDKKPSIKIDKTDYQALALCP